MRTSRCIYPHLTLGLVEGDGAFYRGLYLVHISSFHIEDSICLKVVVVFEKTRGLLCGDADGTG
jgi:hypothetical protein